MNHNKFDLSVDEVVWRDLDMSSPFKVTIKSFTKNFVFAEVLEESGEEVYSTMLNRLFPIEIPEGTKMITTKPTVSTLLNEKGIEVTYIKPFNDNSHWVRTKENKETLVMRSDIKLV